MPALLDMNTSPIESEQAERKGAMRFQYPSGSRPLEGYTIKRGVGRGGFGEVYFAVSDAGKEVALKLIRRNLEVELRGVTHCLNLKHVNLIDIYDIRTDDQDDRWVVMEYVAGASLEDMIQRHPEGMPRDMAVNWFAGICAAVAYLHDHGIVHRDLKPANIFLDEGRVKIGDYGLSKFISCSRRSGQTESVGTVHYMAPEIANGRYGREIDAYALGIILFEMLTGHVPFEGESVGEVLMKHLTAEPDLSRLEEPFRSVVQGAMAKDPERRINSAAEMLAMLRGVEGRADADVLEGVTAPYTPTPRFANRDGAAGSSSPQPQLFPGTNPERSGPRPPIETWREFIHRDPEPVRTSVVRAFRGMLAEMNFREWTSTGRFAASAALLILGVGFFWLWIPVAMALTCWYVAYLVVRVVARSVTLPPASKARSQDPPYAANFTPIYATPAVEPPIADAVGAILTELAPGDAATPVSTPSPQPTARRAWRRRGLGTWRQAAYQELAARPMRDRTATLVASLWAAGIIAPVAALLLCLFTARDFHVEVFMWSAIVGTLASWAIMVPAQLSEGRVEDQAPMRFIQLMLGALVGVAAWCVAQGLFLELPTSNDMGPRPGETLMAEMFHWDHHALDASYSQGAGVQMPLPMYAAYFAFLFVLLRWWRMGEWTRTTRVSLWAIAWCGFVAWVVHMVWWFPQPVGVMTAVTVAFTVQLASPWLATSRRKEMAHAALA
jgi:serine/threonine protein kinase